MSRIIHLGQGRTLMPLLGSEYDGWGNRQVGWVENHPRQGEPETQCGGIVYTEPSYKPSEPHWTQTGQWPEITLAPSLQCRSCPSHGFVRDGTWVDA